VATASNESDFYSRSQLQAIQSAGIKQLEEDMDVQIIKQPLRVTCLSIYLLGAVL
jgi:hypothetical protein